MKSAEIAGDSAKMKRNAQVLVTPARPSPVPVVRGDHDMAKPHSNSTPAPEVYEVRYPFVRDVYQEWDADEDGCGTVDVPSWKPGVRGMNLGADSGWTHNEADGIGLMRLTVVSRHRPSQQYRERVFFTREFVDPDGRTFGKKHLRMLGAQAFKRIATGFRVEYELAKPKAESHS